MTHQTTAEHFAIFKDECLRNIAAFGLLGWRVDFTHKRLADDRAPCCFYNAGKVATITLSTEWDEPNEPSDYAVRRSAFHAICELLLAESHSVALNHSELTIIQRSNAISTAHHDVIRRPENRWGPKESRLKWNSYKGIDSLRCRADIWGGAQRVFIAQEVAYVGAFGRAYVIFSCEEYPGRFLAAMLPALRDDLATADKLYLGGGYGLQETRILCERDLQTRLKAPLNNPDRHYLENVWHEPQEEARPEKAKI